MHTALIPTIDMCAAVASVSLVLEPDVSDVAVCPSRETLTAGFDSELRLRIVIGR